MRNKLFEKGLVFVLTLVFLITSILPGVSSLGNLENNCDWKVDDDGDGDFRRIQDAINAASSGQTICVYSGIYQERVVVDKNKQHLTLKGFSNELGGGTGIGKPVIDSENKGDVVRINTDYCNFSGFQCIGEQDPQVTYDDMYYGISISGSHNKIHHNDISDISGDGIFLTKSNFNDIYNNNISNINYDGLRIYSNSHNNNIKLNTISRCGLGNWEVKNRKDGSGIDIANFPIADVPPSHNNISHNWIEYTKNEPAVSLGHYTHNNIIYDNDIQNNSDHGLYIYENSHDNQIFCNRIVDNIIFGIFVEYGAYKNKFYKNYIASNLIGNALDINTRYTNNWNSTEKMWFCGSDKFVGNEWGDYTGSDGDDDCIGEESYLISAGGAIDEYPISGPTHCKVVFYLPDQNQPGGIYLFGILKREWNFFWIVGPMEGEFAITCEPGWEIVPNSIGFKYRKWNWDKDDWKEITVGRIPGYYTFMWDVNIYGAFYLRAYADITDGVITKEASTIIGAWYHFLPYYPTN